MLALLFAAPPILVKPGTEAVELDDSEVQSVAQTIILEDGSEIQVCYSENCEDSVSAVEIQEIIKLHNLTYDCCITFYNTGAKQNGSCGEEYSTFDIFQPFPYYTYDTELTPLGDPEVIKTDFVISVAKGQTVTLTETYQGGASVEIETGTPYIEALIGTGITCTYEKTQKFSGPPEESQFNSRSFYVKYLGQRNEWVQKQYYYGMVMGVASGTAVIPTEYQAYSIDRFVS